MLSRIQIDSIKTGISLQRENNQNRFCYKYHFVCYINAITLDPMNSGIGSQVMELRIAVVRDNRYLLHQPGLVHPDRPERVEEIYKMLDSDFSDVLITLEPELATLEQLELVHTPNYIRKVLKTSERAFTNLAPDTPVCSQSYLAAWLAVGGCIKGLQALLSGRCDICFALIRPPGHHAAPDRAAGFCIFNNLGVTARYALARHGFRRILIIDWDIHHGNGIQDLFYDQREVFYLSSHYRGWYPPTGDWSETGVGDGLGYTVNLPLSKDVQDADMLFLYWKVLVPIAQSYKPELIFVAAGFDGHHRILLVELDLQSGHFAGSRNCYWKLGLLLEILPFYWSWKGDMM